MDNVMVRIMERDPVLIPKTKTLLEIAKDFQDKFENPIVLAKVNNEIQELNRTLVEDCSVDFLDITDINGFRAYQRGFVFLMVYAVKSILSKTARVVVEHSINKNYYCELPEENVILNDEILQQIERKMRETIQADLPFEKCYIPVEEAARLTREFGLKDKENILRYRRTSSVNYYKLDWFYDYFYGSMVPSAGYLGDFKLIQKAPGFVMQFPKSMKPGDLSELKPLEKISQVFLESSQWGKILKVDTVGALNNQICKGNIGDIIRVAEALHEKKIAQIADMIHQQQKNIILVAGPSSSGKTTFAERLSIQLRVNGIKPYIMSLDNYFRGREYYPLDEFGKPDFEALEALDLKQINEDLGKLLLGEVVEIPIFNFATGKREYNGKYLKLRDGEVLIIEGIHGLNEKVTADIPKSNKFKIFISALTQLNVDDHNRIPTTDTRLIRRIVRDNQFRNYDAENTLEIWPSVQRGEEKNIFPYQEEADAMFNSALVYEMCILKQFVEPLLFKISRLSPQHTEARRIVKFLDTFLGVSSEEVPPNSILREFIGGSCFHT